VPLNLQAAGDQLAPCREQWQPWAAPKGVQQQGQAAGPLFQVAPSRQVRPWAVQLQGSGGSLAPAAAVEGEVPAGGWQQVAGVVGGAAAATHADGGSCAATDPHMLVGAAR
jgi:hypothetical protein